MWHTLLGHAAWLAVAGGLVLLGVAGLLAGWLTRKAVARGRGMMMIEGREVRWPHASLPLALAVQEGVPGVYVEELEDVARLINKRVHLNLLGAPSWVGSKVPLHPSTYLTGLCLVSLGEKVSVEHRQDRGLITTASLVLPPELEDGELLRAVLVDAVLRVLGVETNSLSQSLPSSVTDLLRSVYS